MYVIVKINLCFILRFVQFFLICLFFFVSRLEQSHAGSEMVGADGRGNKLTGGHGSPTLSESREIIAHLQATIQQQNHEVSWMEEGAKRMSIATGSTLKWCLILR